MAKPVTWSAEALRDIECVAEYISRDSIYYAQQVIERMIAIGESVNAYPESGRVVPELGEGHYREKFIYSYRLIYAVETKSINILAIIHGKQLLESDKRFKRN